MNQELMDMAKQAGMWEGDNCEFVANSEEVLEALAALVAAAEREACAKVCDELSVHPEYASDITKLAALAIRARGK
jgi:hypothetical protein